MRLRYTARALAEIEHLQDWLAERSPRGAARTASAIRRQLATLAAHPRKGRAGRVAGTRELVIIGTPYLAAYKIENEAIIVLAVIHSARQWPEGF